MSIMAPEDAPDLQTMLERYRAQRKSAPLIQPFQQPGIAQLTPRMPGRSTPRMTLGQGQLSAPALEDQPGTETPSISPNSQNIQDRIEGRRTTEPIRPLPPDIAGLAAKYDMLDDYSPTPVKGEVASPYMRQMQLIKEARDEREAADLARINFRKLEQMTEAQMMKASVNSSFTVGGTKLPNWIQSQANTAGKRALQIATQAIGTPYQWGGSKLAGRKSRVDCSGLIYAAYRQVGISLPRVSYNQAKSGRVISLKSAQPGDIVVFDSVRSGGIVRNGHVALYVGNGMLLEAPRTGKNVGYYPIGKRRVKAVVRPY